MTSIRLTDRVRRDFSAREADTVLELLSGLEAYDELDELGTERVQAAVLVWAAGSSLRLLDALALAQADWRDVLVASGLANADWPELLDAWLATDVSPLPSWRS